MNHARRLEERAYGLVVVFCVALLVLGFCLGRCSW